MEDKTNFRSGYHDLMRPELLDLIPKDAESILDMGCGTGKLGAALKKRQDCCVEGIELNKTARKEASKNLDFAYEDNLNRFSPSFLSRKFDCIVYGDILEHLIYPWTVLQKFTDSLTENGIVVASIPNIAHPYIINQLQKNLFRYEPAGILDFSHLRFFTFTTIFQLFIRAGLKIFNIKPYPSKENPIQYLVQAIKPIAQDTDPSTTIIMATMNGKEMTEKAILSLYKKTSLPFKLIVVDNNSSDNTVHMLRSDPMYFHIENKTNLGFSGAYNLGMELVDTPYFCIVNNDVLFTQNWLETLIDAVESDKKLLFVGPKSNNISGLQKDIGAKYKTTEEMQRYANVRTNYLVDKTTNVNRLAFFCTLFKTEALNQIGFLDEAFFPGMFEDDDYCVRTRKAGRTLGIAEHCFIHHWGSQTFKLNSIEMKQAYTRNQRVFLHKHKKFLKQFGR